MEQSWGHRQSKVVDISTSQRALVFSIAGRTRIACGQVYLHGYKERHVYINKTRGPRQRSGEQLNTSKGHQRKASPRKERKVGKDLETVVTSDAVYSMGRLKIHKAKGNDNVIKGREEAVKDQGGGQSKVQLLFPAIVEFE